MKIALTGATGHLGTVLLNDLFQAGHHLKVLVHHHLLSTDNRQVQQVRGSVNNIQAIEELLNDVDAVIHAAAVISIAGDPKGILRKVNVEGMQVMLDTAVKCKVKKFIHVSSIHAYKQLPADEPLNETWAFAGDDAPVYDQSKRDGQRLVIEYAGKGLDATIVNPTSIVGPPDHHPSLMGQAIINMCNGKIPALLPGGFNFVDVRDVSKGIINALQMGRKGESYLLAGSWHSITGIAKMLSSISKKKINPPLIPEWIARAGVPFVKYAALLTGTTPLYTHESIDALKFGNRMIDTTKAKRELIFSSRPFEETLYDTYEWFVRNKYIKK